MPKVAVADIILLPWPAINGNDLDCYQKFSEKAPPCEGKVMRILIAVQQSMHLANLTKLLHENGFVTDPVETIDDVLSTLGLAPYDAILLDLGMKGRGPEDVLRLVRSREPERRVLVLSDRNSSEARIDALNKGADDFLGKPFTDAELLARLRALLRRPAETVGTKLRAANVELDTASGRVCVDGNPARLRRREFAILEALMRNKNIVIPRERLEQAVFSFDSNVTPNALEVAISRLRRSLIQHGALLTVGVQRGIGYTLVLRDKALLGSPRGRAAALSFPPARKRHAARTKIIDLEGAP